MKKHEFNYLLVAIASIFIVVLLLANCTKTDSAKQSGTGDGENQKSVKTNATGFVHPGILNTKSSLDFIAGEANNTATQRYQDYTNTVLAYCNSHSPSNAYKSNVVVAGGITTDDEIHFKGDALLCYALALRWAKTGTASYATTVKQILDGWANAFRTMSVSSGNAAQPTLEASWAAPTFTAAAEIIKWYVPANGQGAGWTDAENTQFTTFLNRLKDQYINHVADQHYNNNWDVSAGYAKMAIGIFEDSQTVYQNGLTIIKNMMPLVIAADGSMDNEICGSHNDCTHFQYSLTGFTYAANIAYMQGDQTVYTINNSRLLTGYNYQYGLYHGTVHPSCGQTCSPNGATVWPGIEIADRHYHTTETAYIRDLADPYGLPGGDLGFLGWTTYTHHNVP
ncbi:alginate lyase family protein [Mucilaginibacter celer]|nr:alginate lyase family protein [Mucilaginibacter celer]